MKETIYFGGMVVCRRKNVNERGSYTLVDWSCANKINKSMRTLIFGPMVADKERIFEKGSYFLSNGSVQINEINL